MVPSIVRTACQNMRLPAVHHHDGNSGFASTEEHSEPSADGKLQASLTGRNIDGIDGVSIISAMQDSECGGIYDPSRKFTYHVEQPVDLELEQPHDDDPASKKKVTVVDERCRAKMLDWCAKMVDYFDIDRSVVAVSAYYQDRFLGTEMGKTAQNNRAIFRVVSVTSLYIATKLRVPHRWNVTAHAFAQLCQGSVTGEEINDMEINMLFALGWNVNPPIPMEYAEAYLDLIFNSKDKENHDGRRSSTILNEVGGDLGDCLLPSYLRDSEHTQDYDPDEMHLEELRDNVKNLIEYQLEIALHDNRLLPVRSSIIATASVLNALEGVMNESPFFHGGGVGGNTSLFCQESMFSTYEMMSSCKIASENELEYVRSVLLSSVVSPSEESKCMDAVHSARILKYSVQNCTDGTPRPASFLVSSSPTSPVSKFWPSEDKVHSHPLTPQSVLSRVFAFHYI